MSDDRPTWQWKLASGGWLADTDIEARRRRDVRRLFHAYDGSNNMACEPSLGLTVSEREPNEGDQLCEVCADIVRGRKERPA